MSTIKRLLEDVSYKEIGLELSKVIINSSTTLEEFVERIEDYNTQLVKLSEKPIPLDKQAFEERNNEERIISLQIIEYNTKVQTIHTELNERIADILDLSEPSEEIEDADYEEVKKPPSIDIEEAFNQVAGMYVHLLTPPSFILDDTKNYTTPEKCQILVVKIQDVCADKGVKNNFIGAYGEYKIMNNDSLLQMWLIDNYLIGQEKFNV